MEQSALPSLMGVLISIGRVIPTAIMLVQTICSIMAIYLFGMALIAFYCISNERTAKFFSSGRNPTLVGALSSALCGVVLLAISDLSWMGIVARTWTGTYANSRMLSYTTSSTTYQEHALMATLAMLSLLQLVGILSSVKAVTIANAIQNNRVQATWGQPVLYGVTGTVLWNFKYFSDSLNNTVGFNLIGILTPWS